MLCVQQDQTPELQIVTDINTRQTVAANAGHINSMHIKNHTRSSPCIIIVTYIHAVYTTYAHTYRHKRAERERQRDRQTDRQKEKGRESMKQVGHGMASSVHRLLRSQGRLEVLKV